MAETEREAEEGATLERALAWAEAGWPVFPCGRDKRPLIREWQKQATRDALTIGDWWCQWPEAIPAAVPGLVGCFALDVDPKHGGDASLAAMEAKHDFEAWTVLQQGTPSGGRHLLFRGRTATTRGILAPGLDTRGGNPGGTGLGYICCYSEEPPGSPGACPEGPQGLVDAIGLAPERASDAGEVLVEWDQPVNVARAADYLKHAPPAIEGEGGDERTFRVACTVKDLGVSEALCLELMEEHFDPRCQPPWGEEIAAKVHSAYANGQLPGGYNAIDQASQADFLAYADKLAPASAVEARGSVPRSSRIQTWPERRGRAAPPWIIRGLLPRGALAGLYGPGSSYKSFVALDLALHISTRKARWGGAEVRTHGPVLYVSGEGNQDPRVRAWEARNGEVGPDFALMDGIRLAEPSELLAMARDLPWGGSKPIMVVIDTLARAAVGLDENSAKDMGQIVEASEEITRSWGSTVLLVHHTPAREAKWRGSNAVFFALDTSISVSRPAHLKALLTVDRQKDGEDGKAWEATLEVQPTGADRDGEPEDSLVVATALPKGGIEQARDHKARRQRQGNLEAARTAVCRKLLADLPGGRTLGASTLAKQAAASTGGDHALIRAWITTVVAKGKINTAHPLAPCVVSEAPLEFGPYVGSQEG